MPSNEIRTLTRSNADNTDQDWTRVTGSDRTVGTGETKRPLDVTLLSNSELLAIADHLIKGTQPAENFDSISVNTAADGSVILTYSNNGSQVMRIQITSPYGDFTATFLGNQLLMPNGETIDTPAGEALTLPA